VITKGANALFWWDLLTHQMRFQPVFAFLAQVNRTYQLCRVPIVYLLANVYRYVYEPNLTADCTEP
jgi:hypothetical protein